MAQAGMSFNEIAFVQVDPARVTQIIVSGTSACSDYTMANAGIGSIVLTRKYIPQWAIIVAVIGFWFFLLGVLALLYKETEILTITVSQEGSGSKITVSGKATGEMRSRLQMVLNDLSSYNPTLLPPSIAAKPVTPTSQEFSGIAMPTVDTKQCPECAETIKAAARKCRYCGYIYSDPT